LCWIELRVPASTPTQVSKSRSASKNTPGNKRTALMNSLFSGIVGSSQRLRVSNSPARDLFSEERPGIRIAALAVAEARPYPEAMDLAVAVIRNALSPFEQYHALRLAKRMFNIRRRTNGPYCVGLTLSGVYAHSRYRCLPSIDQNGHAQTAPEASTAWESCERDCGEYISSAGSHARTGL
jgi:hypothetical protein